jgi:glycosyltransferase involved in cell wall biosynthesis
VGKPTMKKERPKVAIAVRCVYDYRIPLYKELKSRGKVNITVFHSNRDLSDHSKTATDDNIKDFASYIKGYLLQIGRIKFIIQPSMIIRTLFGNYDVVICEYGKAIITSAITLFLCKVTKKRFVWWASGWEAIIYPKIDRFFKAYNRFFWKLADGVIVFHSDAFQKIKKARLSKEKIYIAQNTIDDRPILSNWDYTLHRGEELRKRMCIQSNDKVILYVGALIKRKRVDFLIKSFAKIAKRHPNIYLIIVGDGDEKKSLEKLSRKLTIPRVIFVGHKADDVYDYFSMCNVFVLPGLGGLAINDAMICKKPVICCCADGSEKDLIEDGVSGHIIPENLFTEDILAERIMSVISDERINIEMGEKAYLRYLKIATFEKMVENFEEAILDF